MKPHIIVVTSTFPRWKNDTDPPFVYELSRRLTDSFDVTVHTPHYPGAQRRETMGGMKIHRFRYFFGPFERLAGSIGILPTLRSNKLYLLLVPFFMFAQFFSLLMLVYKRRPHIIHAHWIIPQGLVAVLVTACTGVPVVVTAHGADVFGLQGALSLELKRFTLKRVNGVTVVSKALAAAISYLIPPSIPLQVISMGVDSEIFHPNKKNDNVRAHYDIRSHYLLYVGRLTEKKGVCYLVDAMGLIEQFFTDVKLLIVGNGELEEVLKQQVDTLKLCDQVRFVGSLKNNDLPEYYATADVFISPSIVTQSGDTEGFGLTFVEAAMSGCLVIGSRTGGIGDIIQDNKTGLLVPEKDAKALAEKIIYALGHKEEMETIKKSGRKRCIEKYDWDYISKEYEFLFKQCVNTGK